MTAYNSSRDILYTSPPTADETDRHQRADASADTETPTAADD